MSSALKIFIPVILLQ